jgi:hypothetical protein
MPSLRSLLPTPTPSYNPASGGQPHYQTYKVDINRCVGDKRRETWSAGAGWERREKEEPIAYSVPSPSTSFSTLFFSLSPPLSQVVAP